MSLMQLEVGLHVLLDFETDPFRVDRLLGEVFGLAFVGLVHVGGDQRLEYLQFVAYNACLFVQLKGRS